MDPNGAITVYPATGEEVNYWTKINSVSVTFYQHSTLTTTYGPPYENTGPFTSTEETTFSGVAQNIIGDTFDNYWLTRGSFGMKGGCYLGPMMTETPFEFVCRGNGTETRVSNVIGESGEIPIYALSGSFYRNLFDYPPITGIAAPWYITVAGINSRIGQANQEQTIADQYLILPWADFDQGGSFSHSWGWTATAVDDSIVSTQTVSGNFTINLNL